MSLSFCQECHAKPPLTIDLINKEKLYLDYRTFSVATSIMLPSIRLLLSNNSISLRSNPLRKFFISNPKDKYIKTIEFVWREIMICFVKKN